MESEKIVVFLLLIVILLSVSAIVITSKMNFDSDSKLENSENSVGVNYANVGFEITSTAIKKTGGLNDELKN